MSFHYDKESDILQIILKPPVGETFEFETGNFAVYLDDGDDLTEIVVKKATQFVAQAIAAGLIVAETADTKTTSKPVWEDVDSSMISAFKYDEAEQILEVSFHRTGVYRYFDVPPDVVEGLREASSKGSYMRWAIIDMYDYEKGGRGRR